jgi:uncharacterized membrane protein
MSHSQIVSTLDLLNLVCGLGSGLMAGVFFVFSVSVMRALRDLPPACGIAAMQSINRVIINPVFLSVFLGTGGLCLPAFVLELVRRDSAEVWGTVAGSALYLIGVLFVTMRFNVPLNNALDRISPQSSDAAQFWSMYLSQWTAWNHLRTVAGLAAALSFALAR